MRLSADDVLDIDLPDELRGYELVNGELVEVSYVTPRHGRIAALIARRLGNHVEDNRIAGRTYVEAGYVLNLERDPERLRAPDVSFVLESRIEEHGGEPARGFFRLVPDLVVEVDSSDRKPKVEQERIQDYLDAGVRRLWVIHAATDSATIYRADGSARLLRAADALEGEDVLPGFRLPLSDVFR
jgi:Uma2 family endonuclease